MNAEVHLNHVFEGTVCGLCGNFDNDQSNEFTMPDGEMVTILMESVITNCLSICNFYSLYMVMFLWSHVCPLNDIVQAGCVCKIDTICQLKQINISFS